MGDLRRALGYLKKYWRTTLGAFLSVLIVTATNLVSPQVLRLVIDNGITAKDMAVIIYASLALLVVAAVRDIFTFTQGFWSEKASQGVAFDLRNAIFSRIETLSFSYHDKAQTGQLMTRVTSDVDTARTFIGSGILQLVNSIIMLVGSAVILLLMNWLLALIALAMIPAILGVFLFFFSRVGPRFRLVQQKLGNLNTVLQENLAGIRVVKTFVREPYESQRYIKSNDDLLKENLFIVRASSLTFPVIFFVANLGTLGIIWVGGLQAIDGSLSIGELVAFNSYLSYLLMPIFILGNTITSLSQSAASAKRVFEVMDTAIDVTDKLDAFQLTHLHGRVEFQNVYFRYAGSEVYTLEDVSFVAEEGQTIALLGRTGSGKSSLVNLIPRFYNITSGRIMIDEYDIQDVGITSLRAQIGIALQEAVLFSGTIRDNIAYGRPKATFEEVQSAAQAAQAHDFIMAFPNGYDTIVGERGVGLSGGQRQRLAIARTLLLDPALLILDDSTSAVDAETEYQIQQALQQLMKNRTSFIIAQRINTVRNADLILLLDKGKLVAKGTHEQLLAGSQLYFELVSSQLTGDNEPALVA